MTGAAASSSHYDHPRAVVAMVGLVVVAVFASVVLPIMLGGMVDRMGFTARDAGMVVAVEMAGAFAATAGVMLVIHRWSRRWLVLAGLVVLIGANIASAATAELAVLAGARFMAGLGAGIVVATVKACIAATRQPVRVIAILGMSVLLAGAVGLPVMPRVLLTWGMSGTYVMLAAIVVPGLLLMRWLPSHAAMETRAQSPRPGVDIPWAVVGLAALLCYFISYGAIVPYLERLGIASGVDAATVGKVLGAGSVAGIVGAALATWLGMRIGRAWPLCIGISCSIGSMALFVHFMRSGTYAVAAVLLTGAAMFTMPYCLGSLAALDRHGRVLVAGLLMQSLGVAVGPALGGMLITGSDYVRVGWLAMAGFIAAWALFLPLLRHMDRHDRAQVSTDR